MINPADFNGNFGHKPVPELLQNLVTFESGLPSRDYYARGFELLPASGQSLLRTYSEDETFLDELTEFAQADDTGSMYVLWHKSETETPVAIFGSEGGFHIVARNLPELLEILLFDTEPMVDWDGVTYFKTEPEDTSVHSSAFRNWVSEQLAGIHPALPDQVVRHAQEKYAAEFAAWMSRYYHS